MHLQTLTQAISNGLFLLMVVGIPAIASLRKVPVFESFVEGGKEGFEITIKLIPYLVAMIVAIGMLRASGAFDLLTHALAPLLHQLHVPADLVPLALMRPFSGAGSNGILANIIQTHGGNTMVSHMGATLMGSTETTFYVIAVYFGSVGIKRTRHAVVAGLLADTAGIVASIWICLQVFK